MNKIVFYKELEGLPEELEKWCEKALAEIESPEKCNEAAKNLRVKIELLLKECPVQDLEEKTEYVIKKLGKPEITARELKEAYSIKYNKKTDKVIGTICLALGIICSIISFILFYSSRNQIFFAPNAGGYMQGAYKIGTGAGASAFAGIFLIIFGVRVLIYSRSERK